MIFAPHILQVKVITPMDKDEFGRPIPGTGGEYWQEVCKCRCDDNTTKEFHLITALYIALTTMWYARRELLSRLVMKYVAWMVMA